MKASKESPHLEAVVARIRKGRRGGRIQIYAVPGVAEEQNHGGLRS